MFACSVFYRSLLILYFICILLLLLPNRRIKPDDNCLCATVLCTIIMAHNGTSSSYR